jgi:O-Antigen ligase
VPEVGVRTPLPAARLGAAALLLAGPTVLAFFSGGFFDEPRLWAALIALLLVVGVGVAARPPLPRLRAGRAALAGLGLLTLLAGLSAFWAPSTGPALDDAQRLLLYLATGVAAAAVLRPRPLARAVEPALALGALVVIGYGLSERLLPGIVHMSHGVSSEARLDQPLTYWNAEAALAAMGLTLCARLAGDPTRQVGIRMAAAAAVAPLAAGLYLSFSRGALAAVAAGVVLLALLSPNWPQLRALGLCGAIGGLAMFASAVLPGVRTVEGELDTREVGGLLLLAVLVLLVLGAAVVQAWGCRAERSGRLGLGPLSASRRTVVAAGIAVLVAGGVAFAVASAEKGPPARGATAQRLRSIESSRYAYWRAAFRTVADHPLAGSGAGSFRFQWLRERDIAEPVRDAHSLYFETAAELGPAGLLALGLFLGGVAACALEVRRRDPLLAPGLAAVIGVWALACALDWHWEMPAVTLPALIAAGALLGRADEAAPQPTPAAEDRRPTPEPVSAA